MAAIAILAGFGSARADGGINFKMCKESGEARNYAAAFAFCDMAISDGNLQDKDLALALTYRSLVSAPLFDATTPDLDRAIALDPSLPEAYMARGWAHLANEQYAAAATDLNKAVTLDPSQPDAYRIRGEVEVSTSKTDAAMSDFNQAIRLDGNQPYAYLDRGILLLQGRNFDAARQDLTRVTLLKRSDANDTLITMAYASLGDIALTNGADEQAQSYFQNALAVFDLNEDALLGRSFLMVRRGDYKAALKNYNLLALANPKESSVRRAKGYALFDSGAYQDAAKSLDEALKLDPTDPYSAILLYLAHRHMSVEAESELSDQAKHLDLAKWPGPIVRYIMGNISQADLIRSPVTKDPDAEAGQDCELSFYLGEINLLEGRSDDAKTRFVHALAICPHDFDELTAAKAALDRM